MNRNNCPAYNITSPPRSFKNNIMAELCHFISNITIDFIMPSFNMLYHIQLDILCDSDVVRVCYS